MSKKTKKPAARAKSRTLTGQEREIEWAPPPPPSMPPPPAVVESDSARNERLEAEALAQVDHPAHYGGADNPREVIKVIEEYGLGFRLGNAIKYILRADRKATLTSTNRCGDRLIDLEKAAWYLAREIERSKTGQTES